jgi:TctA family transporter
MMLRMIGTDPQSGTLRWTMDTLYLWDGLPLVPLTLGIFALPELCDLAIGRQAIVQEGQTLDTKTGMLLGIKDCLEHWFLILRCSWIGSAMGAIPGIGASVIDWISYGHALRTEKGAAETFGTGDVRGVIAAESATNAREGGALVPTVAFGVPASAGMAILLGAFLIHGLVPGPDMLTKHLELTYSMVWSIAIANILGSGLCFAFSGQLAKIATLRYTLFMPAVLSLVWIGAFSDVLRRAWVGHEALQVAAPAVRSRLHPRRADRALHVHLDRALWRHLAGQTFRARHVRLGGRLVVQTFGAGHPQPRRPEENRLTMG